MAHFLDDRDLDRPTRLALLESTWRIKHDGKNPGRPLAGKHVALIMAKPSLRTRVSFTVAIHDLGGQVVEVSSQNTKLGKGEDLEEWAAVLGRMVDVMVARVFDQSELEALARWSGVPVVNALSDQLHPCQGVADAFTIWEHARLAGSPHSATAGDFFAAPHKWAYLGDGNNVCHSLMLTAASLGVTIAVACPDARMPDPALVSAARSMHARGPAGVILGTEALAAVDGATVVYTDTWVSMGQEGQLDAESIRRMFEPLRVDARVMAAAGPDAIFMHCLPAEPGHEVMPEVLRGRRSVVLDQAENRLWTSKAILADFVLESHAS